MSDDSDNDLFGDMSGSDEDTDELLNASKGKPIAKKKSVTAAGSKTKKTTTTKKKKKAVVSKIPGE